MLFYRSANSSKNGPFCFVLRAICKLICDMVLMLNNVYIVKLITIYTTCCISTTLPDAMGGTVLLMSID